MRSDIKICPECGITVNMGKEGWYYIQRDKEMYCSHKCVIVKHPNVVGTEQEEIERKINGK